MLCTVRSLAEGDFIHPSAPPPVSGSAWTAVHPVLLAPASSVAERGGRERGEEEGGREGGRMNTAQVVKAH